MRRLVCTLMLILTFGFAKGQEEAKKWEYSADLNFYLIPDDFFVLPVFRADKNKLHLEVRYNYEDRETFSGWVGMNFSGGKNLTYTITPMVGGVVGLSNGVATGFELTLGVKKFELYSETEGFVDVNTKDNNFLYTWTDFTYSPNDWLWFGISAQRTRLYQTDLELQRGIMLGAAWKRFELTSYLYNAGFDDPFVLLTLTAGF